MGSYECTTCTMVNPALYATDLWGWARTSVQLVPWLIRHCMLRIFGGGLVRVYNLYHGSSSTVCYRSLGVGSYECTTCTMVNPALYATDLWGWARTSVQLVPWLIRHCMLRIFFLCPLHDVSPGACLCPARDGGYMSSRVHGPSSGLQQEVVHCLKTLTITFR